MMAFAFRVFKFAKIVLPLQGELEGAVPLLYCRKTIIKYLL